MFTTAIISLQLDFALFLLTYNKIFSNISAQDKDDIPRIPMILMILLFPPALFETVY